MKAFKKITAMILILAGILAFSACKTDDNHTAGEKTKVNVATIKGPTGMGMAKLMQDNESGLTENDYNFIICSSPEEIQAVIIKGEADIAAVPINLASALYNKNNRDIQLLAVNTLGVLYILENGNTVNDFEDLAGKKIYATAQASTPEYILRYILKTYAIEKDVEIEFLGEHAELASLMAAGKADLCMLPEPNVSGVLAQNSGVRVALSMTDEWKKACGLNNEPSGTLVQGGIIVNKAFAEDNGSAVDIFMEECKQSVDFVNSSTDAASDLIEKYGILPGAAIAKAALPNCNIVFITGDTMKLIVNPFLKILFELEPKSVGGALPDGEFFYG